MSRTYTARWVFPVSGPPLANGTVTVRGDRIEAVEPHGTRTADEDFGNAAIVPGLVNAHTHLDLSGARGLILPATTRLGNPVKDTLLPDTVAEPERLGVCPREVALDGGFNIGPTRQAFEDLGIAKRQLDDLSNAMQLALESADLLVRERSSGLRF